MFQLTKIWVDPDDKVNSVEIRYTWSPIGSEPSWTANEEAEVMMVVPGTAPRVRQAVLEIPRYLNDKDNYLLHYQFGGGGEHHAGFSNVFTEEIVAREIPYVDEEGKITEVRLLWSVDGWSVQNWTQARLEGLPLSFGKNTAGHDAEGEGGWRTRPSMSSFRRWTCRGVSLVKYGVRRAQWCNTVSNYCGLIRRFPRMNSCAGIAMAAKTILFS
jgi:hypothetical protein